MNWKISKIEILSFKAFKKIHLDFGDSSLLTLDGPNGFGKTSIFDAIELLLTGGIKRICHLFTILMMQNRTIYEDNLLWNNRSGDKDLTIKIKFTNGSRKLILARHTPAADLKRNQTIEQTSLLISCFTNYLSSRQTIIYERIFAAKASSWSYSAKTLKKISLT